MTGIDDGKGVDDLIARVEAAPTGTRRAFFAMTGEWQQPSAKTFNWAGAEQALKRFPQMVEFALLRLGRQRHPRNCYRLNETGMAVLTALRARGKE